jgi:hypothetical protein
MKLELWKWEYTDPRTGKRVRTRYLLTEADARKTYGEDVTRVAGSLEERVTGDAEIQPGYMAKRPG